MYFDVVNVIVVGRVDRLRDDVGEGAPHLVAHPLNYSFFVANCCLAGNVAGIF